MLCGGFTPWFRPSAKLVQKTTSTGPYLHLFVTMQVLHKIHNGFCFVFLNLHYAQVIPFFLCLQPSQSAFHRTAWDILQVGQLAPREWQKVSFPLGIRNETWLSFAHCDLIKLSLFFLQFLPSPLLRGAFVGGYTDAHPGDWAVAWFAPGPSWCHGACRSPG